MARKKAKKASKFNPTNWNWNKSGAVGGVG